MTPRVLVVDNYDSFVFNLVQYLAQLGAEVDVRRNDEVGARDADAYDGVLLSPGPGTPEKAGVCVEMVQHCAGRTPLLGVCLGHQAMAEAFGGRVVRGEPVHGKTADIEHDSRTIFQDLPAPLTVGRYHSLVVDPDLPPALERSASYGDTVMALRHRELPAEGVQFHPESVLTEAGMAILRNFLNA